MSIRKWIMTVAMLFLSSAHAATVQIDFEQLSDGEALASQIGGLTFSNSVVLTAGWGLNEFEFPPRSGSNVAINSGDSITIDFGTAVYSVGAYFTYLMPMSLRAFDAGGTLVGERASSFMSNLALSGEFGSDPNEYLEISLASPISRLVIQGGGTGYSFSMDDLAISPIPEPTSSAMILAGLSVLLLTLRRKQERMI